MVFAHLKIKTQIPGFRRDDEEGARDDEEGKVFFRHSESVNRRTKNPVRDPSAFSLRMTRRERPRMTKKIKSLEIRNFYSCFYLILLILSKKKPFALIKGHC